ncbi:MAG: phenylalanine--tRNA ligase subunit beta [Beijerinckiaceae bacterium]|nr:phenylalanine--tRNA ligase subunit beta [Beijerinckiaceae bacterium]
MKFTLSWLKEHLDTSASLDAIVDGLTKVGLEVEGVEDPAKALAPYITAYVISAEQHPNADRLRVCMVDIGDGKPVQVVCGAPNARTGMKSVFSPPGTYIPGKNITISVGMVRGVESAGMLCSGFELGLSEDHDGIIDLPADAPVGVRYVDYAKIDDPIIDIAVTPNRSDALGVYGVARDLAAAGLGSLKRHDLKPVKGEGACPVSVQLNFATDDKHLAPAFALRLVRGVKNGPSPEWMQSRLKAIGLRPINTMVDITNYITFDRGRPLHVFDAKKVAGNLVVRHAKDGDEILALDGKTYRPDPTTVVICDDNGVESIAGIMGGEHSGCDENTTDVLIESALWDAFNIAQSGRKLGINTDARYRFERGVDPAFCGPGLDLATHMVMELCGGTPSEAIVAGEVPAPEKIITFPWSEVKRLTGVSMLVPEMKAILTELGFWVSGNDKEVKVAVPSWRPDVEQKADIVEEIIRIAGLDQVEMTPFPREVATVIKPVLTLIQKRTRLAKRALAARGLVEAVTWSFIGKSEAEAFGGGKPQLSLANPIASDLSDMRPSLLPGLLKAVGRNVARGLSDVTVFEVGQVFKGDKPEDQSIVATSVRRGLAGPNGLGRHWQGDASVDSFDAKADAFALLEALGIPVAGLQVVQGGPSWYHPGRSGTLQFGPKMVVGAFGEVHPRILEALDVKGPVVACEINLDLLPPPKARPTRMKPKLVLPEFQPVSRDFAFIVDKSVPVSDMIKATQAAERTLITDIAVFDVYEGTGVPEGKVSIALAVTLQPVEKTLTDTEIDAVSTRIVAEVTKKTGAVLRG